MFPSWLTTSIVFICLLRVASAPVVDDPQQEMTTDVQHAFLQHALVTQDVKQALQVFSQVVDSGTNPSAKTFELMFQCCAQHPASALGVFEKATELGIELSPTAFTILLDGLAVRCLFVVHSSQACCCNVYVLTPMNHPSLQHPTYCSEALAILDAAESMLHTVPASVYKLVVRVDCSLPSSLSLYLLWINPNLT